MSKGLEKTNEFRRYRQVLAAIYATTIAAGCVLLAGSVVEQLFFRPVRQLDGHLSADDPSPADLLRCQHDVQDLQSQLARTVAQLLVSPTLGKPDELGRHWEEFSRAWDERWQQVNAWCRFEEVADSKLSGAYHRMARVHADLQPMHLKYQSLLVRFEEEQAAQLAEMRRVLDEARQAFAAELAQQGEKEQTP